MVQNFDVLLSHHLGLNDLEDQLNHCCLVTVNSDKENNLLRGSLKCLGNIISLE